MSCYYLLMLLFQQLRLSEEISRLRFTPIEVIMKRLLNRLATKDPADIFAEPVPLEEVYDSSSQIAFYKMFLY